MKIVEPSYEIIQPALLDEATAWKMMRTIEMAGRTCYKSEYKMTNDSAEKFVRMIIKRGHESVIEHVSLTVRFVIDRGVSHELVRHRLCAFSQESTRYCNYGKDGEVTFVRPPFWKGNDIHAAERTVWREAMTAAEAAYLELLKLGSKPQEARSVLPNSLKTEVVTTANLREWRHILRLRTSQAAHPQIRQVMQPLLDELKQNLAPVFEDINP